MHLRPEAPPELVPEAFSWGALIFGPLWLFAHRVWIAGIIALCLWVVIQALVPGGGAAVLLATFEFTLGLFGHDLRRWSLARRGYGLAHVVAAPDADTALARLLTARPDLIAAAAA